MNNAESTPTVTVVVPIKNEQLRLRDCLNSILAQDYDSGAVEIVLVDGMSTDSTPQILAEYAVAHDNIRVLQNPRGSVTSGVNIGIRAAAHEYIVRMDAHSEFAPDYISQCMAAHRRVQAANVGGPTTAGYKNPCQQAVAAAYGSPFALGGGRQHIDEYEGYADTVSYGCFLKSTAEGVGLFSECLELNEDDDFNLKLLEQGQKIYITSKIKSVYYPRDSYRALFMQYFRYGLWKVAVIKKHRRPARLSHLIPFAFVMFLALGALGSVLLPPVAVLYAAVLALYLLLDIYFSFSCRHAKGFGCRLRLVYIHFLLHLSYGLGFLIGIFKFAFKKIPN